MLSFSSSTELAYVCAMLVQNKWSQKLSGQIIFTVAYNVFFLNHQNVAGNLELDAAGGSRVGSGGDRGGKPNGCYLCMPCS